MWIKICGNTNLEDASLAAQLGADAIGFVFAASPRQVTPAQVAAITPHLPAHVERVGVFHSHDAGQIASIARDAGLTAVQLHGTLDESPGPAVRGNIQRHLANHPDPALASRLRRRCGQPRNRIPRRSASPPRSSASPGLDSPTAS